MAILDEVWEASPQVQAHQYGERVEKLLDLIRSSLFLVTLKAANHEEAMKHVEVKEIVEIEGEHERDQVQVVPLVYTHPLVGSTFHHNVQYNGHQQHIVLNITNFSHLILMNVGD